MVNENMLLSDTFVDPSVVHNISLLFVLHALIIGVPDIRETTVLLDNIVCPMLFAYYFTTVLKNAPPDTLYEIFALSPVLRKS